MQDTKPNGYLLSSHNVETIEKSTSFICNSITKQRIKNTASLSSLLNKVLLQQTYIVEESTEGKLLQIIAIELVDKGIIIPVDKRETEIEYLNSLINFRLPESTFFRCKSLTERNLSVLENKSDDKVIFFLYHMILELEFRVHVTALVY